MENRAALLNFWYMNVSNIIFDIFYLYGIFLLLMLLLVTPDEKTETDAPVFLVKMKDTELLEETYLRFMVKVKGDPNPEVTL